jgi:hypothetical protein
MRLIELKLTNFKGLKDFTFTPNGQDAAVYGDNEKGKTTLADASQWLFFGKDSLGKAKFEIKTLTPDGQVIHGLSHEVEGIYEIGGRRLTLKKVYAEQWTKKRGSAEAVFTGHTTDHFIDGVPVTEKIYAAKIAEIAREDVFKLLTSPTYFNEKLKWEERRKIIMEVCGGDVSDADVIASDKKLAKLPDILKGRIMDDLKAIIKSRRAEINKRLTDIRPRIDENMRLLPDVAGLDENQLTAEIAGMKAQKEGQQQELSRINSGGEIAEKRRQVAEVETELIRIKNEHAAANNVKVSEKRKQLNDAKTRQQDTERQTSMLNRKLEANNADIKNLEELVVSLRNDWHGVDAWKFEHTHDSTCPTCGQDLPQEQLDDARNKALAAFNQQKAEQLEKISATGKTTSARIEVLKGENISLESQIDEAETDEMSDTVFINATQSQIEALQNETTPITDNPSYIQKLTEKSNLEAAIAQLQQNSQAAADAVKHKIADLDLVLSDLDADIKKFDQRRKGQKRIEELGAEEKNLAAEYANLEQQVFLCEQFTKSKVALMEGKINSKFKYARFKMFKILVNGGVEDCCSTLYKGVPYEGGLNRGHQTIIGLDIISTLQDHFGLYPPIWIDNKESITQIPAMKSQVISLIVSEKDKVLNVRLEGSRNDKTANIAY